MGHSSTPTSMDAPEAVACRRLFYPDRPPDAPLPPVLLSRSNTGDRELDGALLGLLLAICRRFVLPWYRAFTDDRELFAVLLADVGRALRQVQVRVGAVEAVQQGSTAARQARTRVLMVLGERIPDLLRHHVECGRPAEPLSKADGEKDGLEREEAFRDLPESVTLVLRCLAVQPEGAEAVDFAEIDTLLVRDILVHVLRTALGQLSQPSNACRLAHMVLDHVSPLDAAAVLWWLVLLGIHAVGLVCTTLFAFLANPPGGAVHKEPPTPVHVLPYRYPTVSENVVELAATALELDTRPVGMATHACMRAAAILLGSVLDGRLGDAILAYVYDEAHVTRAVRALQQLVEPAQRAAAPDPPADAQKEFERLCERTTAVVPAPLRPLLLGLDAQTQRQTVSRALAPLFAPAAHAANARLAQHVLDALLWSVFPDVEVAPR